MYCLNLICIFTVFCKINLQDNITIFLQSPESRILVTGVVDVFPQLFLKLVCEIIQQCLYSPTDFFLDWKVSFKIFLCSNFFSLLPLFSLPSPLYILCTYSPSIADYLVLFLINYLLCRASNRVQLPHVALLPHDSCCGCKYKNIFFFFKNPKSYILCFVVDMTETPRDRCSFHEKYIKY